MNVGSFKATKFRMILLSRQCIEFSEVVLQRLQKLKSKGKTFSFFFKS